MKRMPFKIFPGLLLLGLVSLLQPGWGAEVLDAALQARVDVQVKAIQAWASDSVIVSAVKAQNANPPPAYTAMTQDQWKTLSKLDPFVRTFDQNAAGVFLKSQKSDLVIRAFLSDAAGCKVAFTTKPLKWSHQGDPKHQQPMMGKNWQGPLEQDQASGREQIQISVPVWDGSKPIGSLVVGLSVSKL